MIRVAVTGHEAGVGMDRLGYASAFATGLSHPTGKKAVTFLAKATDQPFAEVSQAQSLGQQFIALGLISRDVQWDGSNS